MAEKKSISITQLINALLDNSRPFSPTFLHRFSDLTPEDLGEIKKIWHSVNQDRRVALIEDLEELAESDTLVCFDDFGRYAIEDTDPRARAAAIRLLWECEDAALVPSFINMMLKDGDGAVRAAAASALGLFVYLGELEEIPETALKKIEESLLDVTSGNDIPLVRRRALESLGFSGRPEVPPLIQSAFNKDDDDWIASALFAMGRSADPQWEKSVLSKLDDSDVEVQLEAVRAAGTLELGSARQRLLEMLAKDSGVDEDVVSAAIWSLSQIGGESVREALEALLEDTDDDDQAEFIEDALENLSFTEDFPVMDMFDFNGQNKEDLDNIVDLSDEEKDDGEDDFNFESNVN
jgi:hypothetical protein